MQALRNRKNVNTPRRRHTARPSLMAYKEIAEKAYIQPLTSSKTFIDIRLSLDYHEAKSIIKIADKAGISRGETIRRALDLANALNNEEMGKAEEMAEAIRRRARTNRAKRQREAEDGLRNFTKERAEAVTPSKGRFRSVYRITALHHADIATELDENRLANIWHAKTYSGTLRRLITYALHILTMAAENAGEPTEAEAMTTEERKASAKERRERQARRRAYISIWRAMKPNAGRQA